ncbi:hypothetical protein SAMN05216571_106143 [Onishia taeanensis]|uniref:Uncharacterized protein n=1 Tax=Onishia taeanensis TaxID=284577 RepID=A0A1G7SFR6_9GAMM|nr:hypothetical protein [Halomonas taeanensis]SDG21917.1 hypothetical protein SAMN05216571_106143 [Halomonas taeanensis]
MNTLCNNVTPLHAPHLDAHNIAAAQLFRTRWENRENALRQCIEHLVTEQAMTEDAAELTAIQAYADLEATNQTSRIDIDASTSHVVILRDESGRPVVFTVADLMHLLGKARAEGRAKVIDPTSERPVVLEH